MHPYKDYMLLITGYTLKSNTHTILTVLNT